MGLCGGKLSAEQRAELERSKKLEEENETDFRQEQAKLKLLLLGLWHTGDRSPAERGSTLAGAEPCRWRGLGLHGGGGGRGCDRAGQACVLRPAGTARPRAPFRTSHPRFPSPLRTGAGESGKSTIFKQMKVRRRKAAAPPRIRAHPGVAPPRTHVVLPPPTPPRAQILYGVNFTEEERRAKRTVVFNNTISSMKALIEACEMLNIAIGDRVRSLARPAAPRAHTYPPSLAQALATKFADEVDDEGEIDEEIGTMIKTLWADSGIQGAYKQRALFQLPDSAS